MHILWGKIIIHFGYLPCIEDSTACCGFILWQNWHRVLDILGQRRAFYFCDFYLRFCILCMALKLIRMEDVSFWWKIPQLFSNMQFYVEKQIWFSLGCWTSEITHNLVFSDIRGSLFSFCCSWHVSIVCFPEFLNTWYVSFCFSAVSVTAWRWWCFLSRSSTHALWICQQQWNQTEDKASLNFNTDFRAELQRILELSKSIF